MEILCTLVSRELYMQRNSPKNSMYARPSNKEEVSLSEPQLLAEKRKTSLSGICYMMRSLTKHAYHDLFWDACCGLTFCVDSAEACFRGRLLQRESVRAQSSLLLVGTVRQECVNQTKVSSFFLTAENAEASYVGISRQPWRVRGHPLRSHLAAKVIPRKSPV